MFRPILSLLAATALVRGSITSVQRRQNIHEITEWSEHYCSGTQDEPPTGSPSDSETACAWFTVPLDYADHSVGTTRLLLVRARATGNRKGTLFLRSSAHTIASTPLMGEPINKLRETVGNDWDIVSFVPRGALPSGPDGIWSLELVNEYNEYSEPLLGVNKYQSIGNLTTQEDADFLLSQASLYDEVEKATAESFRKHSGDKLKYVGTTATVRDVAAMADTLDGSGSDINFWGTFHGTLIGMELIQLFPNRVGKFILDGVVDPQDWTQRQPYLSHATWIADAEEAYRGFTEACAAAGPDKCSLTLSATEKAKDVDGRIQEGLNRLYSSFNGTKTSYSTAVGMLRSILYSPPHYTEFLTFIFANVLGLDVSRNNNEKRQSKDEAYFEALSQFFANYAIICGDAVDSDGTTTEQVFQENIRASREVSQIFGASSNFHLSCHNWPSRAVERYAGPWDTKPKNPVLVIGMAADPLTPFRSAQLIASDGFLGNAARLVKVKDFGHSSRAVDSACVTSTISQYLNGGKLPEDKGTNEEDLVCETESNLLGANTVQWDPVSSQLKPEDLVPLRTSDASLRIPAILTSTIVTAFTIVASLF